MEKSICFFVFPIAGPVRLDWLVSFQAGIALHCVALRMRHTSLVRWTVGKDGDMSYADTVWDGFGGLGLGAWGMAVGGGVGMH